MSLLSENKGTRKMYKLPHTEKKLELITSSWIMDSCKYRFFFDPQACVWDLNNKDIVKMKLTKRMQNRDLEIHIVFLMQHIKYQWILKRKIFKGTYI